MVIVLSIHALHFGRAMNIGKQRQQFKPGIPIKYNQQELDFLNRYLVIILILQVVKAPS
jgi:hypothetical protein